MPRKLVLQAVWSDEHEPGPKFTVGSVTCAMLVELRAYYFWHMPTDTVQPMT